MLLLSGQIFGNEDCARTTSTWIYRSVFASRRHLKRSFYFFLLTFFEANKGNVNIKERSRKAVVFVRVEHTDI